MPKLLQKIKIKNYFSSQIKKNFIIILLGRIKSYSISLVKFKIRYSQDELITAHYPNFQNEQKFIKSIKSNFKFDEIIRNKIDHDWRIHILCSIAYNVSKNTEGDFAECGVFKGDSTYSVINYCNLDKSKKLFWLIDTFDGFDLSQLSNDELKLRNSKQFKNVLNFVKTKFAKIKCARILPGLVPKILKNISSKKFCFVHIDMNAAYPEKMAFKYFFPRLSKGGVIIFDDYGHAGHEEQRIVIDKIASSYDRKVVCLPTGQGLVTK